MMNHSGVVSSSTRALTTPTLRVTTGATSESPWTMAAASMHSAFNIANAFGAWLGGRVLAHGLGYPATGYVGALLSAFGLCVFAVSYGLERRGRAT